MNPAALAQAIAALHFLRPHWLWALLALPLLAWAWRRRRLRGSAWRAAVDPHLLPHLLDRGEGARGIAALCALLLGFAIAVLALAGPSWRKGEQPLLQGEAPLVVALQMSGSMLAADLPPSRLLQARAKLATLLRERGGGQVGLVVFADDAYTVAPLTRDAGNVALFLDSLAPDVMPADGSNAARGIEWSARLLRQAGFADGDILVLADHADAAARDAAAAARRAGYRVSAFGLGTPAGSAYRDGQGAIAHARLDAGSLQALASAGGGRYAALAAGDGDLAALGLLETADARAAAARGKAATWRDDGYWLLLPLMLLSLFAFRRGGMLAAVLLCACLPWPAAQAADGTLWRRADQVGHARMQGGADAYRRNDYAGAERAWKSLPGADAAYNRGNALARAGRYEDAIAAYDEALRLQPAMADAIANRKTVEAAMKRKPPPSKQPGARGQQQKTPDQGKPDDNEPDRGQPSGSRQPPQPQDGDSAQDARRESTDQSRQQGQDRPQPDARQPPSKPADADAQRKADAEQRARMQRALQRDAQGRRDGDGRQEGDKPAPPLSAAQREKQRANEAWLQRVPDDPGGLLRAKFRLEYERRQETGEP
ncbi:MAG TPA: VWA domain-containing protein [Luteimonas sp.]|nr:VWA domain-containing protein [Luteimonas sp.]